MLFLQIRQTYWQVFTRTQFNLVNPFNRKRAQRLEFVYSLQKDEANVAFYSAFRNTDCTANKRIKQSGVQILSTIDRKLFVSLKGELRIKSWKFKRYAVLEY